MFSLLIHGNGTAWETDQLMRMPVERFHEYSGSEGRFIAVEQPETLKALETLPTLLMYEIGAEGPLTEVVRLGRVQDVTLADSDLVFRFEEEGSLPRSVIQEYAERLGIGRWESNRTHWAVKDGGVPSGVLAEVSQQSEGGDPPRPAREPRLIFSEKLGEGAFGSVWLCEDTRLGRRVAAKIFKAAGMGAIDWLEQGRALARVDHPNVNRIFSIEEVVHPETGAPDTSALILEYVEGESLEQALAADAPPCPEALLNIGLQIIEGLEAIHRRGLNHLDLHEENILVTEDGQVRLIDIQYLNSLAALSTVPQASRMRRDFEGLYGVLIRLLRKAVLPTRQIEPLMELQLGQVFDLAAARDRFQSAFTAPAQLPTTPPAAAVHPQELGSRVRALLGQAHFPELDEVLRREFHNLLLSVREAGFDHSDCPDAEMVGRRFESYEAATAPLVAGLAVLGRWGSGEHGRLVAEHLVAFAEETALEPRSGSFFRATTALAWVPVQRLVYSIGISGHSRENYSPLFEVLRALVRPEREVQALSVLDHMAGSYSELRRTEVDRLLPDRGREYTPVSNRLFETLAPSLRAETPMSAQRFELIFDEFEALLCLEHIARHGEWGPPGRFACRQRFSQDGGTLGALQRKLEELGARWPVLEAGFFHGEGQRFKTALNSCLDLMANLRWH